MPSRAIGIAWVNLSDVVQDANLRIDLKASEKDVIRPNTHLVGQLKYDSDLKNAFATIALIDEAVLNLTNFKSPDPKDYFSSQLDLAYGIFDSYGKLINPFGAILNDALVGGDGMLARMIGILPGRSFKTIANFTGILPLDEKGETEFSFDIPEFEGKVRLMAVLWSQDKIAHAEKLLHVRDLVVHDLALPRFVAPQDQTEVPFMLHNMEGPEGDYKISLKSDSETILNPSDLALNLLKGDKKTQMLQLQGGTDIDSVQSFTVDIEGPQEYKRQNHWQISLRSPFMDISKRDFKILSSQTSFSLDAKSLEGLQPKTTKLRLEISAIPSFGTPKIQDDLRKYPYACLEQTASSLYAYMDNPQENADKIHERLSRLYSLQGMEGDFMLWPDSYSNESLISCFTLDTLLKLKELNFEISENVIRQATLFLRKILEREGNKNNKKSFLLFLQEQAYAHYLLAKSQKNTFSQMQYFADNNRKVLSKSKIGSAFMGAAYAYLGDKKESFEWFNRAFAAKSSDYASYGSAIRDLALTLCLVLESTEEYPQIMEKAEELAGLIATQNYLSTQEMSWTLRMARSLQKIQKDQNFSIDGKNYQGFDSKYFDFSIEELQTAKTILNQSKDPLFINVISEGKIQANGIYDKEIADKGFKIKRDIYKTDGTLLSDNLFKQGEVYIVTLSGEIAKPVAEQIAIADLLPAGFEIENPLLYKNTNLYPWLLNSIFPNMAEGRDDRFVASFNSTENMKTFTLSYMVRASFQGEFVFPAPYIESMYRPQFFGTSTRGKIRIEPRSEEKE